MGQAGRNVKKSNRRVVVFITLVSVLTLTSALLLALAPAPLRNDVSNTLFAIDRPESMDVIFQTQASVRPNRWKYIYVHHSRTLSGNALNVGPNGGAMPDHFVIGNGDGAVDGQIQVGPRWDQQASANPPAGANQIDSQCISICLVGDFDHGVPTQMQLRRLTNLVNALQGRFDIPSGQVLLMNQPNSAAGAGKYFPTQAFRETLLP
jgi:hypothetical protein